MLFLVEDISRCSDEMYDKIYKEMPQSRRADTDRYKFSADKRRSVFAYALLKKLLEKAYPEADIGTLYKDKNGKPHLSDENIFISISHSGDFVACAVSSSLIGIDIETERSIDGRLLRHTCSLCEISFVTKQNPADIDLAHPLSKEERDRFLLIWTAKEAYLKLTGAGLSGGIGSVEVADESGLFKRLEPDISLISEAREGYILSVAYADEK